METLPRSPSAHRLVGLVVKVSTSRAVDLASIPACAVDCFSRSIHTSDFKIDTLVVTLPGACRYRVSAVTGRPGVSILRHGDIENVRNFHFKMSACTLVWDTPACCWDVKQPTNNSNNALCLIIKTGKLPDKEGKISLSLPPLKSLRPLPLPPPQPVFDRKKKWCLRHSRVKIITHVVCWLVASRPSNMLVYLRDRYTRTNVCATIVR